MPRKKKIEQIPTNPLDEELKNFQGAGVGPFQSIIVDKPRGGKPLAVDSPDLDGKPIDADLPTHAQKQEKQRKAFFAKRKLVVVNAETIYGQATITGNTVGFSNKNAYVIVTIPTAAHIQGEIDPASIKLSAKKDFIVGEFVGENSKTGRPYRSVWVVDVLMQKAAAYPGGSIVVNDNKLEIHDATGKLATYMEGLGGRDDLSSTATRKRR